MDNDKNKNTEFENVMSFDDDVVEDVEVNDDVFEDMSEDEEAQLAHKIVDECCGSTDEGTAKSAISLVLDVWSLTGEKKQMLVQQSLFKPIVSINKRVEFVQVDLHFTSRIDADLKSVWNTLKKYGTELEKLNHESVGVPFLNLTTVPLSLDGRYYITFTNPIFWSLQADVPGEYATTIRMLFKNEDMNFYETDDIDMNEIEADAQRAVLEREAMMQAYEQRLEEEATLRDDRNARIEELRRQKKL